MRLEELSHINMGQSPVGESLNEVEGTEFHQGKIYFGDLFLQHSPIKTNSPTKLAKAGDILICVRAPVGVVNLTDREVCIGRGLAALTPKEKVPARFLLHLLRQKQPTIEQISTGSTFASITTDQLRAVDLPVPDKATWLRIAGILGSLDEKIEINRRKIAELEALAKTLYDYWFVQFDFPDASGRPYKSSGGKMEWKKELKREIPVGWRIGTINDLGEIVSGGTPSTHNPDYWTTNGIAWITPKDLSKTANKYIRHGENDITDAGLRDSSAQLMPRKSIILSTRAPIGYLAVADCDLCTNQGIKSIIPNKGFGSDFIFYTVLSLIPYIKTFGGGSTFAEISKTEYSSLQVVLPKQDIIDDFTEKITPIAEARRISEIAIEETIQLRDTLLPLLMNGQVNVAG